MKGEGAAEHKPTPSLFWNGNAHNLLIPLVRTAMCLDLNTRVWRQMTWDAILYEPLINCLSMGQDC